MAYLGIDLGTSGLRALLIDASGAVLGSAERQYETHNRQPGWSEQDPADWLTAIDFAVGELRSEHKEFRKIKGIGVSAHMHGAVALDAKCNVIRPCIMWNDTRSHKEADALDTKPDVRREFGNIMFPGFTAPKLQWLRNNEPENFARIEKVVLPAGYINWYLTGTFVSDISDCAGTGWLNVGRRDWSDQLLSAGTMLPSQMPKLVEGSEVAGRLRHSLAKIWGCADDVIVAGGAADNAAAACGIGAINEGDGFVSLGTSGVVFAARDRYRPAPDVALHTFCHALPQRWYQMGVMLSATDALNWLANISGRKPAALTAMLGNDLRPPSTLRFLPYLSGERTPHNDASIRGAFTGLSRQTQVEDLAQSVIEGVAFGLRDSLDALKQTGARFERFFAIGGGAASRYWLQLLATVFDQPLLRPQGGEFGAALGAARLAMSAATGMAPNQIMRPPENVLQIDPVRNLVADFDRAYARFKLSYPAIRSIQ